MTTTAITMKKLLFRELGTLFCWQNVCLAWVPWISSPPLHKTGVGVHVCNSRTQSRGRRIDPLSCDYELELRKFAGYGLEKPHRPKAVTNRETIRKKIKSALNSQILVPSKVKHTHAFVSPIKTSLVLVAFFCLCMR